MKEDFLHYIWKFRKFNFSGARTVDGQVLSIISSGTHNFNSGPDFFNAQVRIGENRWAGNVEIHLKSSDWYSHKHEQDPAYDNVILHVVWEDDVAIFRKDNTAIPTLELKHLVLESTLLHYEDLLLAPNDRWINCERDFSGFDDFVMNNWLERVYLERLERKASAILELLEKSENNWEAVLFQLLAKNFGLKVNGAAFLSMAGSINFRVIQKVRSSKDDLEALFFGQSGLLDKPFQDIHYLKLRNEYDYIKRKFNLENKYVERPKYFRLRPDNFPTIRLSQLAALYAYTPHLFSGIIKATSREELGEIFAVGTTKYWETHYNFGKAHAAKKKKLTAAFIDLLAINTIVPLQFCYARKINSGDTSGILSLMNEIKHEKNSIVGKFNELRKDTAITALHSQALLQLKQAYCDRNACLQCALGSKLIRENV